MSGTRELAPHGAATTECRVRQSSRTTASLGIDHKQVVDQCSCLSLSYSLSLGRRTTRHERSCTCTCTSTCTAKSPLIRYSGSRRVVLPGLRGQSEKLLPNCYQILRCCRGVQRPRSSDLTTSPDEPPQIPGWHHHHPVHQGILCREYNLSRAAN
jgi:hypothetical protein